MLFRSASLRWWRADVDAVLDNELFAVTLGTVPVAAFAIRDVVGRHQRADEAWHRHSFSGRLLSRMTRGLVVKHAQDTPGHLKAPVRQIMSSTIAVRSGGPVGYLEP